MAAFGASTHGRARLRGTTALPSEASTALPLSGAPQIAIHWACNLDAVAEKWGAPDDRTMEIHLTRPFPLVLDALAKADASVPYIMPERLARTDPMKAITEVVGSGPYRFLPDEYVSGARVAYAKFEGYVPRSEKPEWATGGKIAYFPRVEWNVIPDPSTASAAIMRAARRTGGNGRSTTCFR